MDVDHYSKDKKTAIETSTGTGRRDNPCGAHQIRIKDLWILFYLLVHLNLSTFCNQVTSVNC